MSALRELYLSSALSLRLARFFAEKIKYYLGKELKLCHLPAIIQIARYSLSLRKHFRAFIAQDENFQDLTFDEQHLVAVGVAQAGFWAGLQEETNLLVREMKITDELVGDVVYFVLGNKGRIPEVIPLEFAEVSLHQLLDAVQVRLPAGRCEQQMALCRSEGVVRAYLQTEQLQQDFMLI